MLLLELIEKLPVEIVCVHVLGCLELKDLVRLERASAINQQSKLLLQSLLPHCAPVDIDQYETNTKVLNWLEITQCRISEVTITLPGHVLSLTEKLWRAIII